MALEAIWVSSESDVYFDADATTAICGGGLSEDSSFPLDEGSACMAVVPSILATSVTGYEVDWLTSDDAVDV